MSVSQIGSGTASTASPSGKPQTVDYNAFLQLLVAQLKNQDPTDPTDGTQFMAQLASFSNVEQGIQMNAKLDALITASMLGQADGIIGRTIVSADGSVQGVVSSVTIADNALVANLPDGRRIPVASGTTIV
ncbi:MAG: flagellar hook assembly protein FlgD [Beijerinckiaceae bacterium]